MAEDLSNIKLILVWNEDKGNGRLQRLKPQKKYRSVCFTKADTKHPRYKRGRVEVYKSKYRASSVANENAEVVIRYYKRRLITTPQWEP